MVTLHARYSSDNTFSHSPSSPIAERPYSAKTKKKVEHMAADFSFRLVCSPDAVAQNVGSEMVLLHVPSDRFVSLDEVGSAMWRATTENASLDEALVVLLAEFEVDVTRLRADLASFVKELEELGIAALEPPVTGSPD